MATAGFFAKDGLPFFGVDGDDDGGFTQNQLVIDTDLPGFLGQFARIGMLRSLDGFRPGVASGLVYAWTSSLYSGSLPIKAVVTIADPSDDPVVFELRYTAGPGVADLTVQPGTTYAHADAPEGWFVTPDYRIELHHISGDASDVAVSVAVNPFPMFGSTP